MSETVKTIRQTCTCEKCGNESEMVITCRLDETQEQAETTSAENQTGDKAVKKRVKGSATCTQCGNEADMWVDL